MSEGYRAINQKNKTYNKAQFFAVNREHEIGLPEDNALIISMSFILKIKASYSL